MNLQRYIGASLALFAFIFFYEWFVHGFLLMGFYEQTMTVWRDFAEMQANIPLSMLFQLIFAFWTAFIFSQLFREGGIKNGLLFGLYLGVFSGILTATWYLWLPVPAALGWSWLLNGIVEGLGGGLILGSIYHK